MTQSRTPDHFAALYQSNPDPWGFQTNPYEQAKYARSVQVLRRDRPYAAGLEVGCSIGVLTRLLAPLCDSLLGLDVVDQALADASKRCADQPWVRFARMQAPDEWPDGRFDLIVLSEVLYFLSPADIGRCAVRVRDSLLPTATVLLVNWLGETGDPSSGDQAAERFIAGMAGRLSVTQRRREPGYRLDVLK